MATRTALAALSAIMPGLPFGLQKFLEFILLILSEEGLDVIHGLNNFRVKLLELFLYLLAQVLGGLFIATLGGVMHFLDKLFEVRVLWWWLSRRRRQALFDVRKFLLLIISQIQVRGMFKNEINHGAWRWW